MLYIFHGEDDFSRAEALKELEASFGPQELLATNTTLLEGAELTLEQLAAVCNTVPFLAEHRLVIVGGLLSRWGGKERRARRRPGSEKQASANLGEWAGAAETIKAMPDTTVLVLTDGALDRGNSLLKLLAPLGQVKEFVPLRGLRLHSWIQARVARSGGAISPAAVRLLANVAGGSLWALAGEIEKLCLYAQGQPVDDEDVA
ncbi:MAG: DNA polymerase III subunit delta, partial [Dehalococcoidia bacterium]